MKHDWEYKKLGEVAPIICGKDYKSVLQENGSYPIYGSGGIMGYASEFRCPENCTIVGRKGSINNPLFVTTKFWNVDTAFGLNPKLEFINPKYLYYFCTCFDFNTLNVAVTLPSLRRTDVENIPIPLPPLSTQQSIVSELDSLSKIIADCKETLKDYDALEQSIFYDMFGDPVKNEKGWEVKKVIDVVTMQRGFDLPSSNRNSSGHIPVYGSNGILGMHNESKLSEGIITGRSGSIGEVYVSFKPFWPLNTTLFSKDTHGNNLTYLQFLLRNFNLKRFAEGAGVPTLNRNNFHNENIIAPPLPLQQEFATKIEAIEQMKEEMKKALQEAETLFQARMDYWFN